MGKRYAYVPPGGGPNDDWSAADTSRQYTLTEDNLNANSKLGLHMHRFHAETFYILEGPDDFYVDSDWMNAPAGASA